MILISCFCLPHVTNCYLHVRVNVTRSSMSHSPGVINHSLWHDIAPLNTLSLYYPVKGIVERVLPFLFLSSPQFFFHRETKF